MLTYLHIQYFCADSIRYMLRTSLHCRFGKREPWLADGQCIRLRYSDRTNQVLQKTREHSRMRSC